MAFMAAPLFTAFGTAVSGWGALAGATTILSSVSAANEAEDTAEYNAQSANNAAMSNKKQADAAALAEEASGQRAAISKRHDLEVKLSRAQAVAAAGGAGPLNENLISGLVGRGETAAGYDMYTSTERAKTLRFQGEQGLASTRAQGDANVARADSQSGNTILGGIVKGASSMFTSFAPGKAPDKAPGLGGIYDPVADSIYV